MTNSATSTERPAPENRGAFHAWHFFVLLGMAGATAAVMVSRETHPAALLLLSAAVIAAGFVAIALTGAASGFLKRSPEEVTLPPHAREALEREKRLVLRSIKELEFDRAMGKLSDDDFSAISSRLRARALTLMQDLERVEAQGPAPAASRVKGGGGCAACGTANDADARFCKNCGATLAGAGARS
jgi:hypothetical protein